MNNHSHRKPVFLVDVFKEASDALIPVARELESRGHTPEDLEKYWSPDAHIEITIAASEARAILEAYRRIEDPSWELGGQS